MDKQDLITDVAKTLFLRNVNEYGTVEQCNKVANICWKMAELFVNARLTVGTIRDPISPIKGNTP